MSSRSLSDENFEELPDFPRTDTPRAAEMRGALSSLYSMILDIRAPGVRRNLRKAQSALRVESGILQPMARHRSRRNRQVTRVSVGLAAGGVGSRVAITSLGVDGSGSAGNLA